MHTLPNQNRLLGDESKTVVRGGGVRRQGPIDGSSDLPTCWRSRPHTVTATCLRPTEEDPSLAVWVFNCRRQRKQGSLDANRIKRLDAIGFAWAVRTRRFVARDWDAMVAQLEAFQRDHGHCNVPNAWPRNRELAAWLHGVRCNKRSGRLDARSRAAVGRPGRRLGAQANAVGEDVRGPGRVPPAAMATATCPAAGRRIPPWPSG